MEEQGILVCYDIIKIMLVNRLMIEQFIKN